MTQEGNVEYTNVAKHYGDVIAVEGASFTVEPGEFVALLGPSGAGKTTLLRMLAGFEGVSEGAISIDGADVSDVPPHKRNTGMVFQSYALFPHMTVRENIEFGLKRNGFEGDEIDERVRETLEMVDLGGYEDRKPGNLSGGQQQRVATARAVAIQPKVLLMDEPLGALDKKLRDQLQVEISELQSELGITTLYVTHNQSEALTMADRIVVMSEGKIEQIGTPTEIYDEPESEFVADFIGDTNFLDGHLKQNGDGVVFDANGTHLALGENVSASGDPTVFVRPEKLRLESAGYDGPKNSLRGTVENVIFVGSNTRYLVGSNGMTLMVDAQNEDHVGARFAEGEEVDVTWNIEDTRVVRDAVDDVPDPDVPDPDEAHI